MGSEETGSELGLGTLALVSEPAGPCLADQLRGTSEAKWNEMVILFRCENVGSHADMGSSESSWKNAYLEKKIYAGNPTLILCVQIHLFFSFHFPKNFLEWLHID